MFWYVDAAWGHNVFHLLLPSFVIWASSFSALSIPLSSPPMPADVGVPTCVWWSISPAVTLCKYADQNSIKFPLDKILFEKKKKKRQLFSCCCDMPKSSSCVQKPLQDVLYWVCFSSQLHQDCFFKVLQQRNFETLFHNFLFKMLFLQTLTRLIRIFFFYYLCFWYFEMKIPSSSDRKSMNLFSTPTV